MAKRKSESEILSELVIKGISEKKGRDIVSMNLREIGSAVTDYFIVCHGTSRPQVEAIADSVIKTVVNKSGVWPWHKEGYENAEWILLDYVDVVVHIFQERTRGFYQLEKLWADAKIKHYEFKE